MTTPLTDSEILSFALILPISAYFVWLKWNPVLQLAIGLAIIALAGIFNGFIAVLGFSTACSVQEFFLMSKLSCAPAVIGISYALVLSSLLSTIPWPAKMLRKTKNQ